MAKYVQKNIPTVNTPVRFRDKPSKELREYVKENYDKNIRGKKIKNKCLGFDIEFTGQGLRKITLGSALYPDKAILVLIIDKILEVAAFNNFGQPKPNDPKEIAGYLNFKAKCLVDGFMKTVRITAILYRNSGKIYWNHDTSIKKR